MPSHSCSTLPDHHLVGDPVDTLSGAVLDRQLDFRLTGPLELWWYRHYESSQNRRQFSLGWGHAHDFDRSLRLQNEQLIYEAPLGRSYDFPFLKNDGSESSRNGYRLRRVTQRRFQLFPHGEPAMEFEFGDFQQPARLRRLFQGEHEILFHYDPSRRLERIIDSAKRSIAVVESPAGRLISLALAGSTGTPGGLLIAYEYDQHGNLAATKNAAGHGYTFSYDAEHRLVERRGRTGFKFRFAYDEQGRCLHSTGDDHLYDIRLSYPVPRRITKVQRADGGIWTYHFDKSGRLTKIADPLGGIQKFLRDETGRLTGETDPNGNVTQLVYDASGAPVKKLPPRRPPIALPEDPNAPDPRVHRVAANPAEYEFGRLLDDLNSITLPEKSSVSCLPLSAEAKRCAVTRAENENPSLAVTKINVRPLGVKWWPDPESGRIFNDLGKLVGQTDQWGRLREWSYDPSGNLARHTDFDGGKWIYEYQPWHFLKSLTSPLGAKRSYSYNSEGKVASFTDAGGSRSEYLYDLGDRLIEIRRHGNVRDRYTHDAAGNLVAKHASDGRMLLQFEIGPGNLPTKRVLSSGDEHTFEYDEAGRHLLAATKKDKVEFVYDDAGNCQSEIRNGQGAEHCFYDGHSPGQTTVFEKFIVKWKRRKDGTLIITDPGGKCHEIHFYGHGLIERRFSNRSAETAQYDNWGRCHFKHAKRREGQLWQRRFQWSGEGELRSVEDNLRGQVLHEYDAAHRLRQRVVAGRVENYEIDAADNLIRLPGIQEVILQSGNRLHSVNGLGVTYNDRNHIEAIQTPSGPWRYVYDSRDQLITVENSQGSWSAEYDALGRRTRKTWAGQTTEYFWSGDQLIGEARADGPFRLYIYPDPLAMTPMCFLDYDSLQAPPESGRRYFIFTDQIGTPCLIEDESGLEVWRAAIEPFGSAKVVPGAKIEFNLRFPGHFFDAELGLHYNRFRYYDPRLGRYLQSDPWGITGGHNLYAYLTNPLLKVDVRGLGEETLKKTSPCEDKEGNLEPAQPGDSVQLNALADAAGMEPEFLENLQNRCQEENELLVVRDTKRSGVQYHDDTDDYAPKPHDCLLKSDKDSGLVKRPNWDDPSWNEPDSNKAQMQQNEQDLLNSGWTYDSDGYLHNPQGQRIYGDHDLQGAYKPSTDDNSNDNYEPAGSNSGKWREGLNDDAGQPPKMIQHGANDDYLDADGNPKRQPGADEKFTIIDENGKITRINSTAQLEQYYNDHGIPWPYKHYPTIAECPIAK